MKNEEWYAYEYEPYDKKIHIHSPDSCDLELTVDYDDVNHPEVDRQLPFFIDVLNKFYS
jgi:hypothetical protein